MFLAHKISYAKWSKVLGLPVNQIPADAITVDLRTHENTLSFWKCGDNQVTRATLEEVSLAILTELNKAAKIYLIWLSKETLEQDGYDIRQTDGKTKVPDLFSFHYDVCNLNYERLGDMACRVQKAVSDGHWKQFRRDEVLEIAATASRRGRLDTAKLKPKLRCEVESKLGK